MSECDICGDNYTSKLRRQLTCDECHNENCIQCFRNFLLKSEDFSPKCMHCDKVYSYVEIAEITKDKTFCKKVLDNFVKNSLVKEKNKFQIYQEEIKKERKIEQLLEDIDMAKVEYEIKVQELNRHINILKNNKDISLLNYTFIKKCSVQDCQGMLDKDWTCGVCSQETCSECHQHKTENHVCNEDELKTIQAVKKESKECPNCGVGISKIDGCDQMWCIQCQTAFSWKTGNILVNQNIHNPEYFRYRRDRGLDIPRAPGDNPAIIMDDLFDPFNRINNFQVGGIINLNMNNTIIALINEDPTLVSPNTILTFFSRAFNWSVNNLMTQNNMYDKSKIIGIQLLKKEIGTENWEASMKKNTKKYYYDTKLFEILNDFKEKSKISFREILNIMEHGNNSNNEDIEKIINKLRDFYNDLSNLNRDIEFYSKLFGYKKFSFEITTKTEWGRIEKYIFKQ